MREKRVINDMEFCISRGVVVYPVFCHKAKRWFVEARTGDKRPTRFKKPIGSGSVLKGDNLMDPIDATYKFLRAKIEKK